jgi:hypothetical protein
MNRFEAKTGATLVSCLLFLAMQGCERREGPAEHAGKQIDKAFEKAGQQVDKAADKIEDEAHRDRK